MYTAIEPGSSLRPFPYGSPLRTSLHTSYLAVSYLILTYLTPPPTHPTSPQLERDNAGALEAKREDFGKLVAQIECLMETRHTPAQVDALFEASKGSDGRVDLRGFLQRPSTVDWFLASEPIRPEAGDADVPRLL